VTPFSVLVCDDALFMRKVLREVLTKGGYRIVGEAENGRQAVERYSELKPDLVTMDIVMPELGGIDATREILRLDPSARIVMCSAMGQKTLIAEAMDAGAKDFVIKPFQPSRVLEAARRALG
jgi:two-component system, chemotaxis family, chemotaxis protein CheY